MDATETAPEPSTSQPTTTAGTGTGRPIDILDEQYAHYVQLARQMLPKIRSPTDRQICSKYLSRCCQLSNATHSAKSYRNQFFRYFLKVMDATILNQQHYVQMVRVELCNFSLEMLIQPEVRGFAVSLSRALWFRTFQHSKLMPCHAGES
nr:uncharacterized protein LOC115258854 [Aedes albopictus]